MCMYVVTHVYSLCSDTGYRDRHRAGRYVDERESPDLGLRATFHDARLAGSHSNHIV